MASDRTMIANACTLFWLSTSWSLCHAPCCPLSHRDEVDRTIGWFPSIVFAKRNLHHSIERRPLLSKAGTKKRPRRYAVLGHLVWPEASRLSSTPLWLLLIRGKRLAFRAPECLQMTVRFGLGHPLGPVHDTDEGMHRPQLMADVRAGRTGALSLCTICLAGVSLTPLMKCAFCHQLAAKFNSASLERAHSSSRCLHTPRQSSFRLMPWILPRLLRSELVPLLTSTTGPGRCGSGVVSSRSPHENSQPSHRCNV